MTRIGLMASAYGATCTAAMLLLNVALPPLLPRWFTEARWTVGRELSWTLLNVALIGLANALLFGPRFDPQLTNTDQQVMGLPQTPSLKTQQQQQQQ